MNYLIKFVVASLFINVVTSQIISNGFTRNSISQPIVANLGNAANIASNYGANFLAANSLNRGSTLQNQINAANLQTLQAANFNTGIPIAKLNQNALLNLQAGSLSNVANNQNANYGNIVSLANKVGIPNQKYGISVVADALEIGGQLAVSGKLPIYATVAVNGKVPSQGSATANYNCGRLGY